MSDHVEEQLRSFYNQKGWSEDSAGNTLDAALWEDLRPVAVTYVRDCRLRLLPYLNNGGQKILDAASGPIQYPEYLEYSKNFKIRTCVDISQAALDRAQEKLKEHGEYVCCSILDLPFESSSFDAVVSLHTIYHINESLQQKAVSELIRVAKPEAPILVVYSNPQPWYARLEGFFLLWPLAPGIIRRLFRTSANSNLADEPAPVYFFPQKLEWWNQFNNICEVKVVSWRFLTAEQSRSWIPDNFLGDWMFKGIKIFENAFPKIASRWCIYPMIILRKRRVLAN